MTSKTNPSCKSNQKPLSHDVEAIETAGTLIQDFYSVFPECKKLPHTLDACVQHCISQEDHDTLRKCDRKQIPTKLIWEYNSTAHSNTYFVDAEHELKHFLPRMAELILSGEEISLGLETHFSRFTCLRPQDWNPKEIDLLRRFAKFYLSNFEPVKFEAEPSDALLMLNKFPIPFDNLLGMLFPIWEPRQLTLLHMLLLHDFDWQKHQIINGFAEKQDSEKFASWLFNVERLSDIKTAIEKLILSDMWIDSVLQLYDWLPQMEEIAKSRINSTPDA